MVGRDERPNREGAPAWQGQDGSIDGWGAAKRLETSTEAEEPLMLIGVVATEDAHRGHQ